MVKRNTEKTGDLGLNKVSDHKRSGINTKQNELEFEKKRLEDLENEIKAKKDSLEEAGINTTKQLPGPRNQGRPSFNLGVH